MPIFDITFMRGNEQCGALTLDVPTKAEARVETYRFLEQITPNPEAYTVTIVERKKENIMFRYMYEEDFVELGQKFPEAVQWLRERSIKNERAHLTQLETLNHLKPWEKERLELLRANDPVE